MIHTLRRSPAALPGLRLAWAGLAWLCLGLLAACAAPPNLPTIIPPEVLPTAVALTAQALVIERPSPAPPSATPSLPPVTATLSRLALFPSRTPTASPTASASPTVTAMPTRTATPTITPTPTDTPRPQFPRAEIRINRPGPLSRVTSPVAVRAVLAPGAAGVFRVELLGEDGRLLARKVLTYTGIRVNLSTEIDFAIPGVAETGRLQITTQDEFGRVLARSSVTVILLSVGPEEITPAGDERQVVFIQSPAAGAEVQGGTLAVSGKTFANPEQPLLVQLITREGQVVGERLVGIRPEAGEDFGAFQGEIRYTVREPIYARLTVYVRGDRLPDYTHIVTMEILISP
jgi:hypothetical protein